MRYLTTTLIVVISVTSIDMIAEDRVKGKIAVLDFDYGTVQSSVAAVFGSNVDIGKGISDLLVEKLAATGAYTMLERRAMDKILLEQNFSVSDRSNPAMAAKLARILGADAIVVGSITQFGRDDKSTMVDTGLLGGYSKRLGLAGVGRRQSKAVVGVTARLVNTTTAEIVVSETAVGEASRSGMQVAGGASLAAAAAAGVIDMRSSDFANTIVGEATAKAVDSLSRQLAFSATKVQSPSGPVEGIVADVTGSDLVLNIGNAAGVRRGQLLQVVRATKEIKDPATGKLLRKVEEIVGTIEITDADAQSSAGRFTGTLSAKVGDIVRTPK